MALGRVVIRPGGWRSGNAIAFKVHMEGFKCLLQLSDFIINIPISRYLNWAADKLIFRLKTGAHKIDTHQKSFISHYVPAIPSVAEYCWQQTDGEGKGRGKKIMNMYKSKSQFQEVCRGSIKGVIIQLHSCIPGTPDDQNRSTGSYLDSLQMDNFSLSY